MSTQEQQGKQDNKQQLKDKRIHTDFGDASADPNFDPSKQNSGIDAGKPRNPNSPTPKNLNQDEGNLHPMVASDDRLKASGKRVHGGINEPVITRYPTSRPVDSQREKDYETIANATDILIEDNSGLEFADIKVSGGILIPVSPGKTIDQVVLEAQKKVHQLNLYYSIPEVNDEGEELQDSIIVKEFKRNEDKTIQLGPDNKPITGANAGYITRRIQLRQYAVKNVVRSEKISEDGALIVRVF